MKKALILCILIGSCLYAFDPYVGDMGCSPWWVADTSSATHGAFNGISVVNDTIVYAVGSSLGNEFWKRQGGLYSYYWTNVDVPGSNDYKFNDVCFVNSTTGWIVGYRCNASQDTLNYKGIVYYTINGGQSWSDQTGNISGLPNYPTAFCQVQFADVYKGYIACANGIILKTLNGGSSWQPTSSQPWNNSSKVSVWYTGLWVDPNYPDTLWVSGDAFGILAKSTDGGATWTSYQDNVFKQTYTFPSGTSTPYDTRLANFNLNFQNLNTGYVAFSYGKVGRTTNGGSSWDTIPYEPQPSWFYDVGYNTSDYFAGGNYGVMHRFNGTDIQEHVDSMWIGDYGNNFRAIGAASSALAHGVGHGKTCIRQRYKPCNFSQEDASVGANPASRKYGITLNWIASDLNNVKNWYVTRNKNAYLLYGPTTIVASNLDPVVRQCVDSLSYTWEKANYYYCLYVHTNDDLPASATGNMRQPLCVWKIDSTALDSMSAATFLDEPGNVFATDKPNDQGHSIDVTWSTVSGASNYYIGRATSPNGPYRKIGVVTHPNTSFTDTYAQTGVIYYYVVSGIGGWGHL